MGGEPASDESGIVLVARPGPTHRGSSFTSESDTRLVRWPSPSPP